MSSLEYVYRNVDKAIYNFDKAVPMIEDVLKAMDEIAASIAEGVGIAAAAPADSEVANKILEQKEKLASALKFVKRGEKKCIEANYGPQ